MIMSSKNQILKVFLVVILLACIFAAYWQQNVRAGGKLSQPAVVAENNVGDTVPGNPAKAVSDAAVLYKQIQLYRRRHGGRYPKNGSELFDDRVMNHDLYGYSAGQEAAAPFANPDAKYSDNPALRRQPDAIDPFLVVGTRPDGTAVGSAKPAGTRDVVAWSDLYFHENITHYKNKDTIKPIGFIVVVWDDGAVQKVPYQQILFVPQFGTNGFAYGFAGQAGVGGSAIPYDEFRKRIPRS